MKQFSLVMLFFLLVSSVASAQLDIGQDKSRKAKAVLSLTDAMAEKKTPEAEEKKEDKGIFSFMNFSFSKNKKKPEEYVRPNEKTETFLQRITRQADEGDVDAQLTLGYMYLYGENGVSIDYKKAFDYYSLAAAQNDNIAVNNLGSLYFSGIGTAKDVLKAAMLFEKASKLGNVEATVNLAFIYISGNGVLRNSQEAINLFKKAAEAGNPTAKFMTGYAYYKGFMIKKDLKKAVSMMREAANAGYDDAQYVLAVMYLNGEGITKNYGNAVKYLYKAIEQGNVDAMVTLGDILALGIIYNKDLYKAHILFNVAAVRGAEKAAEKRDVLEKNLKIEEFLQAQSEAEKYEEHPSELTVYIKKTFGDNVRKYIDDNLKTMPVRNIPR